MNYLVYAICDRPTGAVVYVGFTTDAERRWKEHLSDGHSAVYRWLRRVGTQGCRVRIYSHNLSLEQARLREDELIWRHRHTVFNRDVASIQRWHRLMRAGMVEDPPVSSGPVSGLAPPGACAWCDHNRAIAAERLRRHRERRAKREPSA